MDNLIALPRHRAIALARVTPRQLRYWDLTNVVKASIRHGASRLYSFDDLVALLVTAQLRRRGFSLQHVRKIVKHLLSRGYTKPLAELHFATYGREIYFRHPDGSWEGDATRRQLVIFEVIDLDLIRTMIRNSLSRPPEFAGKIESYKGRKGGKPVFKGTRIPVSTVISWLNSGRTSSDVLRAYPDLTQADIDAARELAAI